MDIFFNYTNSNDDVDDSNILNISTELIHHHESSTLMTPTMLPKSFVKNFVKCLK